MILTSTYSFTRPADTTAYAANDLVANSTTAASVVFPNWGLKHVQGGFKIIGVRINKSNPVVTNAQFRLWLFGSDPGVPTNGDNGSMLYLANGADYIDYIDFNMTGNSFSHGTPLWSGFRVVPSGAGIGVWLPPGANRKLWGVLMAQAAYTPASGETFKITLELDVG